jgi:hypothetical protein
MIPDRYDVPVRQPTQHAPPPSSPPPPRYPTEVRSAVESQISPRATPMQREQAYVLIQSYVDRVGGVGDAGITAEALPARTSQLLEEAQIPTAAQDAIDTNADQIAGDVDSASRGEKGAALAVNLRRIEQADGSEAAAQAFAAFAEAEPELAAQAVVEFERDKVDGGGFDARLPEGFVWEDARDVYADPDATNELIRQGGAVLGGADAAAVDAYTAALANELVESGAANNALLYFNVASEIAGGGSEALQRSFVNSGLQAVDALLGDSGDPYSQPAASLISALGHVAAQSPTVARDVFVFTQSHDLGQTTKGNWSFETVLQIFATEGTALPSGHMPTSSLKPSYLAYMDALLGPGAEQGALSSYQALTIFETVSNSAEVWPTGTTLLEQGDIDDGSRGTAQMAQLFQTYMPQWIDAGSYAWNPQGGYDFTPVNLIAGLGTGTLDDRFDSAFTNFMEEALFDPNEKGAYRQPLMGAMVGMFGDLASGTLGVGMDTEARGRLVGGLMGIVDQGFDEYAAEIRSDAETDKAWASFGIGLAFSLVPGVQGAPKIATILISQGIGQGEGVVTDTVNQLIDAGVTREIASASAEAANRGDMLGAFEQLGLSPAAQRNLEEYIDLQQVSLGSGDKTVGELFRDIFGDGDISPDSEFRDGVSEGWRQVQERE